MICDWPGIVSIWLLTLINLIWLKKLECPVNDQENLQVKVPVPVQNIFWCESDQGALEHDLGDCLDAKLAQQRMK